MDLSKTLVFPSTLAVVQRSRQPRIFLEGWVLGDLKGCRKT
jgi:hypothetical protein